MAIFHFDLKAVSRREGKSAVESWAYASGTRQVDERTGLVHDYSRKAGEILFTGHAGPVDWQATERAERNWNAKVARTLIVALPHELDLRRQVDLLAKFANGLRQFHGFAIGWTVQEAPGDPRNRHGHLVLTTRQVDENGVQGKKTRELDVLKSSKAIVTFWRQRWALICNSVLAGAGSSARVDWRSLTARGLTRPARMHLGPERSTQQRKSYRTAAAEHNAAVDEIERANEAIVRVNRQIKILSARRRRARVERQIMQGHRRWRKRTAPLAAMPESMKTNQQAAASPISQPRPIAAALKKPTRRH